MEKINKVIRLIIVLMLALITGMSPLAIRAEEVFVYGTTAYGPSQTTPGVNPQIDYSGWSAIRYGVGETLFRFNDDMTPEPWLTDDYEQVDQNTLKFSLKPDITFSNGEALTPDKVKKSLESLIEKHERAANDLKITEITVQEDEITIVSEEGPTLINSLSDPYAVIIDVDAKTEDHMAIGTGPYIAENATDTEVNLIANENYWGKTPEVKKIKVIGITDGDTLAMAVQNGEVQLAQGLPYASYPLFKDNDQFKIDQIETSRVYQIAMNFDSEVLKDDQVRAALTYAVDKNTFAEVLLDGNGTPTQSPFPNNYQLTPKDYVVQEYDLDKARELLKEAGWVESNGKLMKDNQQLKLRYVTYGARQELPLLAEMVQGSFQELGIDMEVIVTDDYQSYLDKGDFDLYSMAIVTAPTGDSQYYLSTQLGDSEYNVINYHNEIAEDQLAQLRETIDREERMELTENILNQMLADHAYIYTAHLKMALVMDKGVEGISAHPTDYYEITSELTWNK